MNSLRLTGIAAFLALLCAPVAVQAQSCSLLRARLNGVSGDLLTIAREFPMTHAAIALCMMSNNSPRERDRCADNAVEAACFLMGSADCNRLISLWEQVALSYQRISAQMRATGCSR